MNPQPLSHPALFLTVAVIGLVGNCAVGLVCCIGEGQVAQYEDGLPAHGVRRDVVGGCHCRGVVISLHRLDADRSDSLCGHRVS